jgi:23S rRNA (adenine2030-N6)-methyltransferase
MFSYRHGFHAGNHADVLKHMVLIAVLKHLTAKPTALTVVDTHAGAGLYRLDSEFSDTSGEAQDGILKLRASALAAEAPPLVSDYLELVASFNPSGKGKIKIYPGSPFVTQALLRQQPRDKLWLFELHPTDSKALTGHVAQLEDQRQVALQREDGFEGLRALLPPPSRRALVLIDPSYEIKTDYGRVVATVREALTRFADAVMIVWYPQLLTLESAQLPQRLQPLAEAHGKRGWLHARLTVQQADAQGFGMIGSGLFVANPPFPLHESLRQTLPFLVDVLGEYAGANFLLEQRAA